MDSEFAKKLTFNIAIFSEKERLKDFKMKTGKNTYMVLNNNEPFDTWRAQLLVRIEKLLNPSELDNNDYEIHFTIARISPQPLMVSSEEEFANMLERVEKSKDLACNVYVQELCLSSKVDIWVLYVVASSNITESTLQKQGKENPQEDSEGDSEPVEEEGGRHKKKKAKTRKTKVLTVLFISFPIALTQISDVQISTHGIIHDTALELDSNSQSLTLAQESDCPKTSFWIPGSVLRVILPELVKWFTGKKAILPLGNYSPVRHCKCIFNSSYKPNPPQVLPPLPELPLQEDQLLLHRQSPTGNPACFHFKLVLISTS